MTEEEIEKKNEEAGKAAIEAAVAFFDAIMAIRGPVQRLAVLYKMQTVVIEQIRNEDKRLVQLEEMMKDIARRGLGLPEDAKIPWGEIKAKE